MSGLLHLHELDLSENSLPFIQYGVLEDLYFLSKLKLEGNPWMCNYRSVLQLKGLKTFFGRNLSIIYSFNNLFIHFSSIHYMVYWLRLHPGVKYSGLRCHAPREYTGGSVEKYVHSYNRECPKDRQLSRTDNDQTDPELWGTPMEVQGELEEELEPSHLRIPEKYEIIRLS